MAFKFRKRIKIAPGVTVNVSKSGISGTVGAPGASVNIGKKGAYLNTGIPGTGIYDRQKIGGSNKSGNTKHVESEIYADETVEIQQSKEKKIGGTRTAIAILCSLFFAPLGGGFFVIGKLGLGLITLICFMLLASIDKSQSVLSFASVLAMIFEPIYVYKLIKDRNKE